MDNKAKLTPPWFGYVNKLIALFEEDPEIKMDFDDDNLNLKLYVDNTDKADALDELLPDSVDFGGEKLIITVIPDNENYTRSKARLLDLAFRGNPVVTDIVEVEGAFTNPMMYIEFRKEVIQFYDDNLGDLHGNRSTLLQDIAKEVFDGAEGVFFCTDNEEDDNG